MDIYFGRATPDSIAIGIDIRPDGSPRIESFAPGADVIAVVRAPGDGSSAALAVLDLNDR
jgi:hypothetical protein